jgi:hypothetical protein
MPNEEIPLRDAPEHFFDRKKWEEFLTCNENRQAALQRISQQEPGMIVFYRREVSKTPTPEGAKAQQDENIAELGKALVSQFKERLIKAEILATGLSSLAVDRVTIPAERWPELWLNFAEDKANGGQLEFAKIRLSEPLARKLTRDLKARCVTWMQKRREDGETRKKALKGEAQKHFGTGLTTRIFDAAYKEVFAKARGRPKKLSQNNPQK